jgi:hypothetical protein
MNKLRLILDLRYINSFLEVQKFKYESIREVSQLAKLGDYLFSVDLKYGYHHVDVAPEFWQYLRFEWHGKYYVFCQLPFGMATACFVFTKLMKQLVTHWRKRGIRVIPYIPSSVVLLQNLLLSNPRSSRTSLERNSSSPTTSANYR